MVLYSIHISIIPQLYCNLLSALKRNSQLPMSEHSKSIPHSMPSTSSDSKSQVKGFLALKKLKDTESHIQMMRKRVNILLKKEEKSKTKEIQIEKKKEHLERIQERTEEEKEKLIGIEKEKLDEVEKFRQNAHRQRNKNRENVEKAREKEIKKKIQENKAMRKQHFYFEDFVTKNKKQQLLMKQQWRKRMSEIQKRQKVHSHKYKQSRIRETINAKTLQAGQLISETQRKEKQLERLSRIEMQLAKKQSESITLSKNGSKLPGIQSRMKSQDKISKSQKIALL